MLCDAGLLGCRPVDFLMDSNFKLLPDQGELFDNPRRYKRLVGKLNYLTVIRPDIAYTVVSHFLATPRTNH